MTGAHTKHIIAGFIGVSIMNMNMPEMQYGDNRPPGIKKQEEGPDGLLLFEPPISWPTYTDGPVIEPIFQEHACWMRLDVMPDADLGNEPGQVKCRGCGRVWRLVEEYKP